MIFSVEHRCNGRAIVLHSMFSFIDDFSCYNQINMNHLDTGKTALPTSTNNFHYIFMPFGLTNVVATYQRVTTVMLHDYTEYVYHCEVQISL